VSLWLSGQYLSVSASIGFIELFGLVVGNEIVLVSYINQLRHEGQSIDEALLAGCSLRLRPVVMMMTTLLGLLPLALAQGIGAEVQRPLASVVIGGLFTSTALTLIVLPVLYSLFAGGVVRKEEAPVMGVRARAGSRERSLLPAARKGKEILYLGNACGSH